MGGWKCVVHQPRFFFQWCRVSYLHPRYIPIRTFVKTKDKVRPMGNVVQGGRARVSISLGGRGAMMIRSRTTAVVVAFNHLLALSARKPPLAFSAKHRHVFSARAAASPCSMPDADAAIARHERKRAQKSRSFRRRQAPITRGQRRTLRELWPKFGLVTEFSARYPFN